MSVKKEEIAVVDESFTRPWLPRLSLLGFILALILHI